MALTAHNIHNDRSIGGLNMAYPMPPASLLERVNGIDLIQRLAPHVYKQFQRHYNRFSEITDRDSEKIGAGIDACRSRLEEGNAHKSEATEEYFRCFKTVSASLEQQLMAAIEINTQGGNVGQQQTAYEASLSMCKAQMAFVTESVETGCRHIDANITAELAQVNEWMQTIHREQDQNYKRLTEDFERVNTQAAQALTALEAFSGVWRHQEAAKVEFLKQVLECEKSMTLLRHNHELEKLKEKNQFWTSMADTFVSFSPWGALSKAIVAAYTGKKSSDSTDSGPS